MQQSNKAAGPSFIDSINELAAYIKEKHTVQGKYLQKKNK